MLINRKSWIFGFFAIVIALNYFAFRVELFGDEFENNHPAPTLFPSLTQPSLTWETFDKDNAPQAFRFEPETGIGYLYRVCEFRPEIRSDYRTPHIIRDKSPPLSFPI
jgi:hypothetical protein